VREKETPAASRSATTTIDHQLLSRRISDLALTIRGTRLEAIVDRVHRELAQAGMSFRPAAYLSDEWGCPSGVPVIGIPFYLADPVLCAIEAEMTGIEAETEAETMVFLRHEVGHAFSYAYRLFRKRSWRALFGSFSRPYLEEYRPAPFSMSYVRNAPAWYAQKHPDDDFAETFGVWLDPASNWREAYAGTPALAKLVYVECAAATYGKRPPLVHTSQLDRPVEEMTMTLDGWYQQCREAHFAPLLLPPSLDIDLRRLFPAHRGPSAADFLTRHKSMLVREVNNWTGVDRHLVAGLIDALIGRIAVLGLRTLRTQGPSELARASAFATTLAMNYLRQGKYIPE
jgi:hypothetical protein